MIFAGYRVPKTTANVGTTLGTWTVGATDALLYRNILAVTLTPATGAALPESPYPVALPAFGVGVGALALVVLRRRRLRPTG